MWWGTAIGLVLEGLVRVVVMGPNYRSSLGFAGTQATGSGPDVGDRVGQGSL